MTLSRNAEHERMAMLVHANEKQLKGLMRPVSARPVQRGASQESLSHTATHTITQQAIKRRRCGRVVERSNLFPLKVFTAV